MSPAGRGARATSSRRPPRRSRTRVRRARTGPSGRPASHRGGTLTRQRAGADRTGVTAGTHWGPFAVVAVLVAAVGGVGGYAAATADVPSVEAARAGGTAEGQLIAVRKSARLGYERGRREGYAGWVPGGLRRRLRGGIRPPDGGSAVGRRPARGGASGGGAGPGRRAQGEQGRWRLRRTPRHSRAGAPEWPCWRRSRCWPPPAAGPTPAGRWARRRLRRRPTPPRLGPTRCGQRRRSPTGRRSRRVCNAGGPPGRGSAAARRAGWVASAARARPARTSPPRAVR